LGCYEDIDNADVFVTWGNNMAEMHPVLFSRMLANKGSGMGLAISKVIVNAHEGEIKVKSRQGSGASFYILLPLIQKSRGNF